MKEISARKYCTLMDDIKRRTEVVDAFLDSRVHAVYKITTIESVYLQFRKILEHIAFSSLAANEAIYSSAYANFETHWNGKRILSGIEALNPKFYPNPVIQQLSRQPGVKSELTPMEEKYYLTRDQFVELYEAASKVLHTANPFSAPTDFDAYGKMMSVWRERVLNLLNCHFVKLVNDPNIYLIQMGAKGKPATSTTFAPKPSVDVRTS